MGRAQGWNVTFLSKMYYYGELHRQRDTAAALTVGSGLKGSQGDASIFTLEAYLPCL
jgi:hypothetical protein